MTAANHCANGESCAAYAKLGGPSKLSRYNPETVCGECLLARRAARSAAAGEDTVTAAVVSSPGRPKAKGSPAGDGRRNKPPKPKIKTCACRYCLRPGTEASGRLKGRICEEHAEHERAWCKMRRCYRRVKTFEKAFDKAVEAGGEGASHRWLKLLRRAEEHWIESEAREQIACLVLAGESTEGVKRYDTPYARWISERTRLAKPPKHSPNGAAKREKRPAGGVRAKTSPARTPEDAAPAKQITEGQRWFTVSEVARRLAVQPKTVYEWIRVGELGATKFGPQTTRVRVSELERFEEEGMEC